MKSRLAILPLVVFATSAAYAGVSKLSSPAVTKDKAEIEYSGTRYGDDSSTLNNKQTHQLELEYGFTDNFKLGIEGKAERKSKDSNELKFYGLEAQYELTQQGQWWLDSAVKAEYARAVQEKDADSFEVKALLARKIESTKLLANVTLERELGDNRKKGISLESKLQATQSLNEYFNPGIEWHGDFGKINKLGDNDRSEHYIGPVIMGDLFKLAGGKIEYTAGYYWGVTDDSTDNAARLQLGYEIKF
jgi:hypothetical protein